MTHLDAFERSLEVVAERCEDPVFPVYSVLFARFPDVQKLFVLDTDHGARGHMLNEVLSSAQDLLGENEYAETFIASERQNHDGYDISSDVFEAFYTITREVFVEIARDSWSPDMDAAWDAVLEKVRLARF